MYNIDLSRPCVMTILNITPDSFYAESRTALYEAVESRVIEAIEQGATIIDVGGYSSRPMAAEVSVDDEWARVDMGIGVVRSISFDIPISLDTFRAEIVRRSVAKYGAVIVNDITAGEGDEEMFDVVAEHKLPYIAMHMRGTPQTMQSLCHYDDVVEEVVSYFRTKVEELKRRGVDQIILDPGFGFAKSVDQNYELLAAMPRLCELGYPVLAGLSRKSMIYKVLDTTPDEALAGTVALGWEALRGGATILRVHDTREAFDTIQLFEKYRGFIL